MMLSARGGHGAFQRLCAFAASSHRHREFAAKPGPSSRLAPLSSKGSRPAAPPLFVNTQQGRATKICPPARREGGFFNKPDVFSAAPNIPTSSPSTVAARYGMSFVKSLADPKRLPAPAITQNSFILPKGQAYCERGSNQLKTHLDLLMSSGKQDGGSGISEERGDPDI